MMLLFRHLFLKWFVFLGLIFLIYSIVFHLWTLKTTQEISSTSNIRIMYVVRTSSYYYSQRLIYLLQTWISLVSSNVFFVSDLPLKDLPNDHLLLTHISCGHDAHSMNTLCCKTAHDFLLFHRFRANYDWFCHFDDDQYVHVLNLEEYLTQLDPQQPYYIGRNSWSTTFNRTKEPYPHPFWFATLGAGVCLSKRLVDLLEPYTRTISLFIDGCLRENYQDDIYLGFLISAYLNVTLTRNEHFHSHLEAQFYHDQHRFLAEVSHQITFGFRLPDRLPIYLPDVFSSAEDPYRIRTLHCLLYVQLVQCQKRLHRFLFNQTSRSIF